MTLGARMARRDRAAFVGRKWARELKLSRAAYFRRFKLASRRVAEYLAAR